MKHLGRVIILLGLLCPLVLFAAPNSAGTGPASDPSNDVTAQTEVVKEIFQDGFEPE